MRRVLVGLVALAVVALALAGLRQATEYRGGTD